MFRRLTTLQLAFDIGVAALCFLLRSWIGLENPAIWLVVLGMAGAFALRRLNPGLALAVAWAAVVLELATGLNPDISNAAILPVLYATARYGEPTVKWLGLVSAGVGSFIAAGYLLYKNNLNVSTPFESLIPTELSRLALTFTVFLIGTLATLGLSWTLGLLVKTWRAARDSRQNQLAAEQAFIVEQERNRIARDMHDVVAHSLAVVIAQADGARYARQQDPSAVDEALSTISGTAREALADVRLLLGQLRHSQDAGPQPVLADLDRMLEQMRSSGLTIDFRQEGEPVALPAARQLAIYRIIQEALTNALRHGDPAEEVSLAIAWAPDAAAVTVSNALRDPAPESHQGHGIAGMRERALLVGGTLGAAADGDRFLVQARIPVAA